MASPFDPARFVKIAPCLPCCENNAPPTPGICDCDLAFYEWSMFSGEFDNYENAANAIATQTAGNLIVGRIDAFQLILNSLAASYDPQDVSPNLQINGLFNLPGIGLPGVFIDYWIAMTITPGASITGNFDISGNALTVAGVFATLFTCAGEEVEMQEIEGFTGQALFANNLAGGEYLLHLETYGETDQNTGSTFWGNWVVTSSNVFTVGQPVARLRPDLNVVLDELRSRPGFDQLFDDEAMLETYLENYQANCLMGLFANTAGGVGINAISASLTGNVLDFDIEYDDPNAVLPVAVGLTLEVNTVLAINVRDIPTASNVLAELRDRTGLNVLANNSQGPFLGPFLIEITAPNTGEYILTLTPGTNGAAGPGTWFQNYAINIDGNFAVNPIVPFVSLGANQCPQVYPCEIAP